MGLEDVKHVKLTTIVQVEHIISQKQLLKEEILVEQVKLVQQVHMMLVNVYHQVPKQLFQE